MTLTAISSPEFFLAYVLMLFLAVRWPLFHALSSVSADTSPLEHLQRIALPALTLVLVIVAHMMRMTRAAIINLLASPYIEMARLKGLSPARVIVRHALPNAWAPIVNVIALNLAYLIVGVVVVEVVFVYPGIGQLMVDAVVQARPAGGAGLRPDLRRDLHPAQSRRRHRRDRHQPAAAAPAMSSDALDAAPTATDALPPAPRRGWREQAWRELRRAPVSALFGLAIVLIYVTLRSWRRCSPPTARPSWSAGRSSLGAKPFLLGTDQLGRDMLSRLIFGARNTIGIAFLTTALAFGLGGAARPDGRGAGRLDRPAAEPRRSMC